MLTIYMSFLAEKENHLCAITDKDINGIKEFIYKDDSFEINKILKKKNIERELYYALYENHYFFEFLIQHNFNTIHLNYLKFFYDRDYLFLFSNENNYGNYWFDTDVYPEKFGMMSDFDCYSAVFEHDQKNDKWKI